MTQPTEGRWLVNQVKGQSRVAQDTAKLAPRTPCSAWIVNCLGKSDELSQSYGEEDLYILADSSEFWANVV